MKRVSKNKGFTLVELLVAIVILGIITVMAIPQITNLISSNESAKYEAYEDTIETSAKLYTDSYTEDMFGNNESGCYDIKFDDMINKKLIQDISMNNVTCAGGSKKETFVRVYKSGEHYKYKVSIICTDKNNISDVLYSNIIKEELSNDTTFCDGKTIDVDGPTISVQENGSSWTTGVGLKVRVTVADPFGLLENAEIKYAWTTTPSAVPASAWVTKKFTNARYAEKASFELEVPQNKNEDYYLVIRPVSLRDANGNYQTKDFKSNAFQFDNTAPTCSIAVDGTKGLSNWYVTKPSVTMTYKDTRGVISTYGMSTTNETNNSKLDFNKKKSLTQSDTTGVTWYGYIKDGAGNIARCNSGAFKVDTTPPTKPTSGKIAISGSSASATLAAASGSTDATSGVLEYRYIIKNDSSTPSKTNTAFKTSRTFTRTCGTSYYAFAIAVDKAGNVSDVYSMGNTKDGADKYSSWTACTKSCGTGTQTRTNTCALVTTGLSQNCNTQTCCSSVNYGKWTEWSTCTVTCGGGKQTRTRKKTSAYDGTSCGTDKETRDCNTQTCCSSTYASPGSWGTCSKSCGTGTQSRTVNYYSNYNNQWCSSTTQSQNCNTHSCCSSTYYGSSSSWGSCSASCGGGTQYQEHYYYSNYTGEYCSKTTSSQSCNTHSCCGSTYVGGYGGWGGCSASCGGGTQYRDVYYYSNYNGQYCSTGSASQSCNTHSCCSSTYVGGYGSWGGCSASCGGGTQYRDVYHYSNYTGQYCSATSQSQSCNTHSCCSSTYVGGYGSWGSCSASCGGGTQYADVYYYSNYNGQYCSTGSTSQSCNTHSCCSVVRYSSSSASSTYCWNFASTYMGGGANWNNGKLSLCTDSAGTSGCVAASDSACGKMGGTYMSFKYCP